jgi:hypothetical protein
MSKRVVIRILAVVLLLAAVIANLYNYYCRDIPEPDTSDLVVVRPVVAPEENAYPFFSNAVAELKLSSSNDNLIGPYVNGEPVDDVQVVEIVDMNKPVFDLIRQGLEKPRLVVPLGTNMYRMCQRRFEMSLLQPI